MRALLAIARALWADSPVAVIVGAVLLLATVAVAVYIVVCAFTGDFTHVGRVGPHVL